MKSTDSNKSICKNRTVVGGSGGGGVDTCCTASSRCYLAVGIYKCYHNGIIADANKNKSAGLRSLRIVWSFSASELRRLSPVTRRRRYKRRTARRGGGEGWGEKKFQRRQRPQWRPRCPRVSMRAGRHFFFYGDYGLCVTSAENPDCDNGRRRLGDESDDVRVLPAYVNARPHSDMRGKP